MTGAQYRIMVFLPGFVARAHSTTGAAAKQCGERAVKASSAATAILGPGREAQAGPGSGRRAIAGDVFEPAHIEVLERTRDRDPVQDLRAAGVQLVARQVLQERGILVGAGFEDGAVEILVHQKMAQAPGGEHADPLLAGKFLDRLAQSLPK